MKSYVYIVRQSVLEEGLKTRVWFVRSKSGGEHLGTIKWHGAWRQYCFFPVVTECGTIWSRGCLAEVTKFMEENKGARK